MQTILKKQNLELIIGLGFVGLLMFATCADKSPTTNSDENNDHPLRAICEPYSGPGQYPLDEGNYWIFEWQHFFEGKFIETDTIRAAITGLYASTYNDTDYCISVEQFYLNYPDDVPNGPGDLFMNRADGLYYMGYIHADTTVVPRLKYKFPVQVGDSWLSTEISGFGTPWSPRSYPAEINYRCVAVDEPYVTPLETFNCIVYAYTPDVLHDAPKRWHYFDYFVPGIGLVGMEAYFAPGMTYIWDDRLLGQLGTLSLLIDYGVK